ncbi:astroprincin family protein [Sulfurimonas sp.]|uniref:astroprincin family protein n=1 Tax=Sulfurimonas sp. TaxID=2022749 RepID=UPI003D136BA4
MGIKSITKGMIHILLSAFVMLMITGCNSDTVTVVVKGHDGALLKGASVTIGEESGVTDEMGVAVLEIASKQEEKGKHKHDQHKKHKKGKHKCQEDTQTQDEIVVRVTEDGFVNQSIVTELSGDTTVLIVMQPVKETLYISNIENEQVIQGSYLGAQITLPANALVKPDGTAAEGNVTLELTPWDIQNSELNAMLGNGQALDADGNLVELISAGMMSVSFYDEDGNYLQLDTNKTADIQMDLPLTSINNQALTIGSTIPLWHFDETQGLWIEDGEGVVIAADTLSGLALSATVSHFSTWNWDFKFENAGSVDISCELADGTATECAVVANVTLDDGSHLTKSKTIPAGGLTVINMPSSGSIVWNASTITGLIGTQTSGTTGNVVIVLSEPTTQNFVQCDVNGTAVACDVTLSNPSDDDLTFSIPASGSTIATAIEGVSTLSWSGQSKTLREDDKFVYYTGSADSNLSEDVAIHLTTRVEVGTAAHSVILKCTNPNSYPIDKCNISVSIWSKEEYTLYENISIGSSVVYTIPTDIEMDDYLYFQAYGQDGNNTDNYEYYGGNSYYDSQNFQYADLVNNQLIELELDNYNYY